MSADAWEHCPVCRSQQRDSKTVREDYDLGLNEDGTAYVYFTARCAACGAKWKYENKSITQSANVYNKKHG